VIRGIYTAAAGMAAEMARQDVLANNLANVNTDGFKQDLAVFKTRADKTIYRLESAGGARGGVPNVEKMGELSTGVYLDSINTQFEQGTLRQTDEPLDLAIEGDGYLVVQGPGGGELLTRGGSFTRNAQGLLVDPNGRPLLGKEGPITFSGKGEIHISNDGVVRQGSKTLGTLRLVNVDRPNEALEKRGDVAWSLKGNATPQAAQSAQLRQGYLEGSNVNPIRAMVEMIAVQRSYESSQKMITAQDETLGKAVNDLGRV